MLAQAAGLRLLGGDPERGRDRRARGHPHGPGRVGARPRRPWPWASWAGPRPLTGDVDRGVATFRRGMAIAERLGGVEGIALGHANLAALLDRVGRTEASLEAAREGSRSRKRLGVPRTYGGVLLGHVAKALFDLGRWDEAAAAADEGLELDPVGRSAIWLHLNRARVDTNQGRFDAAEEHLRQARELDARSARDTTYRAGLVAAVAELAAWQGRLPAVRAAVEEALAIAGRGPAVRPGAGLARVARPAGRGRRGRRGEGAPGTRRPARHRAQVSRSPGCSGSGSVATDRRGSSRRAPSSTIGGADPRAATGAWPSSRRAGAHRRRPDPEPPHGDGWDELGRPAPAAYARYRAAEAILATTAIARRPRRPCARPTRRPCGSAPTPLPPRDRTAGAPRPDRPWPRRRRRGRRPDRHDRPDRTRTRGHPTRRGRPVEPADRRHAVHHPQDRERPRLEHPGQARRREPRGGGGRGPSPRTRRATRPTATTSAETGDR